TSLALREERIQHMAPDRRRRDAAMAAVLDEDRSCNLRIVARREEHEPAVVAQVLVGLPLRRLGALVRNHLRRARLARHVVAGHPRAAAGARAVDDEPESIADRLDRLG